MPFLPNKYWSFCPAILLLGCLLLSSFGFTDAFLVSVPAPIRMSPSYNFTPEFALDADSVVIPLKRAGRLFLIEAQVDGVSGNLVFDTGANGLVLNSTYFRSHVKSGGVVSNGITGSVGTVEQVSVDRLEFADLKYAKLLADVTNLGHIENRRGVKIIGLIGFSLLRSLEIVFDPAHNELKLFRIDKSGKRINPSSKNFHPDYMQKIDGHSQILFLQGTVGGRNLNFCLDTGAETNAISSDLNKKVMSTITITRRASLKGAGTAVTEVLFGRMNSFRIGSREIQDMETVISNLDAVSEAYGTHIDGMLGSDFLEHGVFCINFLSGQFGMRFTKGGNP